MALKYIVKNFEDLENSKLVGFVVTDANGNKFAIDKEVSFVEGKSDASYVQDAYALATPEIEAWQNQFNIIGKVFNPEDNSLNEDAGD